MNENVNIPNEVNSLLLDYTNLLETEFSNVIYGIYLYGSIALSAFDERKSDVDFITILKRSLTNTELGRLSKLHQKMKKMNPLAERLDGMYIHLADIGKENNDLQPYPCCASGTFKKSQYWDMNHVTWWTLKHHGISVTGVHLDELKILTSWCDVEKTMSYNLNKYWANKAKSGWYFLLDDWVEDAVLTMCRIYCSLKYKKIIPKEKAVEYALQTLPNKWSLLFKETLRLRHGDHTSSFFSSRWKRAKETKKFLLYMINDCNLKYINNKVK
ncbi:aminoglycoside adenylyltransferase domain-containing protein [Bacillus sp. Hm123]|uniref:nucleotidyltransferase domain-containing protein n=1 Tax=Bacillus sp. Hm123 TaxID=3450745 RepID=UPI003F436EFC